MSQSRRNIDVSSRAWPKTSSAKLSERIKRSPILAQHSSGRPITSYRPYEISAPYTTALFDGIVQGVVVQMTTLAESSVASPVPTTLNFTHTVKLSLSWYSTSASARAVFSIGDHITGFDP